MPIPGSGLPAKFSGPYEIGKRVSDTDYVICTPERKRKTKVCHINMLKFYHTCEGTPSKLPHVRLSPCALIVSKFGYQPPHVSYLAHQSARVTNSEMLKCLPGRLSHWSHDQQSDILVLNNCLFRDVPFRTMVAQHDIDIANDWPIKQHA